MSSHKKLLIDLIAAVDSGANIDLTGHRMSGRTALAHGIHRHFRSLKRDVLVISGKPMLRNSPLAGAGMAGIDKPTVLGVAEAIAQRLGNGKGMVIVDDWEHLDRETWAALIHAHQTAGVPLITIRLINFRGPGPYDLPGVAPARSFEIPPLSHTSLATVIRRRFGFTLDSRALAQVVAYSTGAPGLALAVVDAAHGEGLLAVEGDIASMRGSSLWTQRLSDLCASMLSALDEKRRRTLEQLSVLGTVPLPEAVASLGEDEVAALADVDLIHMEQTKDGVPVVSIRSILVDEYLRRQQNHLRFQLHGWGLGQVGRKDVPPYQIPTLSNTAATRALGSTMVHFSRAVAAASKRWKAEPSLVNAIDYIKTLCATTADLGEIDRVLGESAKLAGAPSDIAHWGKLNYRYRAYVNNDVDAALAQFEHDASQFPTMTGLRAVLQSHAALFRGEDPQVERLPATYEGLLPETERWVLWTKFLAAVVGGRMAEARQLRPLLGPALTAQQFMVAGLLDIADGHIRDTAARADERFTQARVDRAWQDLPQIMRLSGLAALLGAGASRFRSQLIEYDKLGAPTPYVYPYQSVLSLWAAGSIWDNESMPVRFPSAPEHRISSPLPGSQTEWQEAYHLVAQGRREDAGNLVAALADRQWEKGHRFAAACSYLLAAYIDPRRERLHPLETRVLALDAPGLTSITDWLSSLCRGHLEAAEERINDFEAGKTLPETRGHWLLVSHLWAQRGQMRRADLAAQRAEQSLQAIDRPARPAILMPAEFSAREQDVIHYLAAGLTYREIAEVMGVSVRAIEGTSARAMKKANVSSRAELVAAAGIK